MNEQGTTLFDFILVYAGVYGKGRWIHWLKNVYHLNIRNVLNQPSGHINDSIMTELNYRVDYLKQSPEKVAQDFLMEQSLYRKPLNGNGDVVRIGSKIFGEQFC